MSLPKPTDAFAWTQAAAGLVLRCRPLLAIAPHLFTTAAMRLRDDEREWERIAEGIDVDPAAIRLIHQVHGREIAVVRPDDPPSSGRPEADIAIADDTRVAVAVRVADCAPILIADRAGSAVAAAHAGWRGTIQDVAGTSVRAMRETFGSDPANLVVAVGPSLGACCGEMGPEVVDAFRAAGHAEEDLERWFTPGPRGRPHFDLWRANRDQLERAGVLPASIHVAGLCSRCRAGLFHSYRAAGTGVGRMAGVIRPGVTSMRSVTV